MKTVENSVDKWKSENFGKMQLMQLFTGTKGVIAPPGCDNCPNVSRYYYASADNRGLCLCISCQKRAVADGQALAEETPYYDIPALERKRHNQGAA